ncbi:MAG TPA: hypothetical protein PL061_12925 [Syntrophales bacterium]|nr:hypothetical protein [Syntrophales bacterium]
MSGGVASVKGREEIKGRPLSRYTSKNGLKFIVLDHVGYFKIDRHSFPDKGIGRHNFVESILGINMNDGNAAQRHLSVFQRNIRLLLLFRAAKNFPLCDMAYQRPLLYKTGKEFCQPLRKVVAEQCLPMIAVAHGHFPLLKTALILRGLFC